MDMRLIFLDMWGFKFGLEKVSGIRGLMVIPYAYRKVRVEIRVRPDQGHDAMLPRKDLMY